MTKILNKNISREFSHSIGRFLALVALISLAVFVLVGLKVTGPDMKTGKLQV
ncbi:hypothetical protein [Pediococcus argentinicus]|uniref:Uncharacterized protein n=1 Tax=Pediococcus argentinicus TaxID=480391 RepID=A0A0R2NHQ2_9LACO|nr:hypothetical protein [Pediococcus argentinicus]KRO25342.1 hypothetical protein IV88_GL000287 [Pediococcus argentinicus]NKZ22079.1 hypothetical protein [Pediococcus argentinicus]GEP19419.1 hypothetical protein LSA03_08030 [Pediococcus argentinicus]